MLILGAKNKKNKAFLKSFRSFNKEFSAKDFFAKNFPNKSLPAKTLSSQKPPRPQDKSTNEPSEISPGIKILFLIIGVIGIFFLWQFFGGLSK
ncbi:MAG: hypothetical protein ABIG29_01605 [Candidatus Nealsonbacteria bacterium]